MKGFFACKPTDMDEVRAAIGECRRAKMRPTEIRKVGEILLTPGRYHSFTRDLMREWSFLQPYTNTALHNGIADCVFIGADGQPWIAVRTEGFSYPRYVALVQTEEE